MLRRMGHSSAILVALLNLLLCASKVKSTELDHRYNADDWVPFYANKIGPYNSPSETYAYYDLPFCSPGQEVEKESPLVNMFGGDRLAYAPYYLEFLVNKDSQVACTKNLTRDEVSQFRVAIAQAYEFQLCYDDLPIRSFIGKLDYDDKKKGYTYHLYTHIDFEIFYNDDRVIKISPSMGLTTVELIENEEVEVTFSYSALWMATDDSFEKRMDMYYSSNIEPYWYFVTCLTVPVLLGLMAMFYNRVLKNSLIKHVNNEELAEYQEETLWKNIHLKRKALFAAAVGLGTQMIILMFLIIMLGLFGVLYQYSRGFLLIGLVVVYSITSGIAGFTAVSLYSHLEGTNWVQSLLLTGSLFSMPIFNTFEILNHKATTYGVLSALSISAISFLLCIWIFVALPLLFLGGIFGKNKVPEFEAMCDIAKKCPKVAPQLIWYKGLFPQMVLAGILPCSIIYNELYYVFAGIWGPETFTEYPSLLIVTIILVGVTAFVTVALTYSQLAAGNQDWWWRSFLYGGSTGLYVYGYCLYYYHQRSDMWGSLQKSFFLGYMGCLSYGLFLMLGTVGFCASLLFVRHIYGSMKRE